MPMMLALDVSIGAQIRQFFLQSVPMQMIPPRHAFHSALNLLGLMQKMSQEVVFLDALMKPLVKTIRGSVLKVALYGKLLQIIQQIIVCKSALLNLLQIIKTTVVLSSAQLVCSEIIQLGLV